MIGNVFYNMLNSIGVRERDERMVNLSSQVKEMLQTRSFDNIVGQKVPHLKNGVLNLLKVVDLPMEDRAELMRLGFGDLLMNPSVKPNQDPKKTKYDLKFEADDPLKASTISINIVCFKTSLTAPIEEAPRRFYV